ncbi:E3 ubiquitin-protein ligase TRIM7 [Patella vulgata]|uniref:E3 ubiquitin-protein ligase TRIM7 n=1 Tax=Patella vulgata TaxID=6465 RepID=UPI00217FED7A|nr:E3 ubiquitin-protein ligase TRIM7 [Patella vulgata]
MGDANPLICSICLNEFREPKIINCFHSFCKSCLIGYVDRFSKYGTFDCPLCRCNIPLPEHGVAGFSSNFYLEQSKSEGKENLRNSVHSEKNLEKVAEAAKDSDVTRDETKQVEKRCSEHKKEIEFYCKDCSFPLCCKCLLKKHKEHSFVDIDEVVDEARTGLLDLQKELEKHTNKLEKHSDIVKSKTKEVKESLQGIFAKIDEYVEQINRAATTVSGSVKDELQKMSEDDLKRIDEADLKTENIKFELKSKLDKISYSLMDRCNVELIDLLPKARAQMKENRQIKLIKPEVTTTGMQEKITLETMYRWLGVQLEAQGLNGGDNANSRKQDSPTSSIKFLVLAEKVNSSFDEIDVKTQIPAQYPCLFKYADILDGYPTYSKDFHLAFTSWYISIVISKGKLWISLFLGELKDPNIKSVTAKFTLTLVNYKRDNESIGVRDMKVFYPPQQLIFDSYVWRDVIDSEHIRKEAKGFLDSQERVKILVTIAMVSVDRQLFSL